MLSIKNQGNDYLSQHFTIEMKRSGGVVKMMRQHDLEIKIHNPSCSTFEITSKKFPWRPKNVVVLCFGSDLYGELYRKSKCYSFDGNSIGKISNTTIGDSNFEHYKGGLIKYKRNLLTVGGTKNQKTEILERNNNGTYIWSTLEPDYEFTEWQLWNGIQSHSLVNIKSSDMNEEFILLSGGYNYDITWSTEFEERVYKFNGTWHHFGQLRRPRAYHSSIYWDGAVYFIGGRYHFDDLQYKMNTEYYFFKNEYSNYSEEYYSESVVNNSVSEVDDGEKSRDRMEIWKIQDHPDRFETTENWPELFNWEKPHLFIVPDSFFPDH